MNENKTLPTDVQSSFLKYSQETELNSTNELRYMVFIAGAEYGLNQQAIMLLPSVDEIGKMFECNSCDGIELAIADSKERGALKLRDYLTTKIAPIAHHPEYQTLKGKYDYMIGQFIGSLKVLSNNVTHPQQKEQIEKKIQELEQTNEH